MFKEAIAAVNMNILPTIALLLFVSVFVGVVIWSFRKGSSKVYESVSSNALNDGPLKK
ncbi:cbb3-type cytochrome c oxidase subunit 3 [Bacteriovorax sp. Seq25_V]|uniref:cbb3-type cytochrome c oxidase subunit 3 n=1 Tax=Bacteriovorax sp. Seq25_V TaxID=1201288 RepID=UPI00038A0AAC|nr:cbb3-type cytochrome c oxidase subunit 3 [Bacteriovorax sp. Seq25_V]EQC43955.1 cytochrome C oxidase, Cbb3-type, CcoQ subunit [Bacteriovorax sp. Seq25_V]